MTGWTKISNAAILRASEVGAAFPTYCLLLSYARDSGECWPSVGTLAADSGQHRATILRNLATLQAAGWITITKANGRGNVYGFPPIVTGSRNATGSTTATGSESATGPVAEMRPDQSQKCDPTSSRNATLRRYKKKTQEKDTKKKTRSDAAEVPAGLLELIDGWNGLGKPIVFQAARRDPPSAEVLKGWHRLQKDAALRPLLADVPAIVEAIRGAGFCHGQPWFTMPWLFGRNSSGESKLEKLLTGGYTQKERNNGRIHTIGPGQRYDPAVPVSHHF